MNAKMNFARECTTYAQEHNLPFQMVLALKKSDKRIEIALKSLEELNKKLIYMNEDEQLHIHHNLHEVGEYRVKKQLKELGLSEVYSRFISEKEIMNIIWKNTKFNTVEEKKTDEHN